MAGDWIKMRTDLYRDPKVCVMADILADENSPLARYVSQNMQRDITVTRNVMRNVTVGALVAVWGVMRQRGKRDGNNLIVRGVSLHVVDDIADLPGFGDAMESVGWIERADDAVVFPRFFDDYNVDPNSDHKAKNAERQRRLRERKKEGNNVIRDVTSNATVTSQSNVRVEKSREEKKEEKPLHAPPAGGAGKGSRLADDWVLPDAWADEAQRIVAESGKSLDVKREAAKFRDFWVAKSGKDGVKRDWLATWRNWVRNAVDRAPAVKPGPLPSAAMPDYDPLAAAAQRKFGVAA